MTMNPSIAAGQFLESFSEKDMVSLGKYFGEEWKKEFTKKEEIMKLFQALNITNEAITDILPVSSSSKDRCSILATVRNLENRTIKKVIIDIITGSPTWEQFIDVTYDIGAGRDLRIIVFDGAFFGWDMSAPKP